VKTSPIATGRLPFLRLLSTLLSVTLIDRAVSLSQCGYQVRAGRNARDSTLIARTVGETALQRISRRREVEHPAGQSTG
jgi:hypothetical protein